MSTGWAWAVAMRGQGRLVGFGSLELTGLDRQPGRGPPMDSVGASPLTVLNGLCADQAQEGTGLNTSGGVVDFRFDQTLAGGQVFIEHPIGIHPSHQHAAAQMLGGEVFQLLRM